MLTTSPWCRVRIGYLVSMFCPRRRRLVLEGEGDLLLLAVDAEDVDLEFLVDLHHVVRVGDAVPAHVRDVQQAVDAAEVHERAEVGDVLDDPLADLMHFQLAEELLLHVVADDLDQLAAAHDDVAALLVDLEDHALDRLADVLADVGRAADVHLRGRQEDVDADVDEQAALDLLGDRPSDDVAFLVLGEDRLPLLLPLGLAVGEADPAGLVFDGFQQDFDGVAGAGDADVLAGLVLPLVELDDAFGLVANVDHDIVAANLDDLAGDDLVGVERLGVVGEPAVEAFGPAEEFFEFLFEAVVVVAVELPHQVAIDHIG